MINNNNATENIHNIYEIYVIANEICPKLSVQIKSPNCNEHSIILENADKENENAQNNS